MDGIQTNSHKQDNLILKSNLWKFFKTLRVQANPIYCLLVESPISYAWIAILDKSDSTIQKRISIAQFVNSLKKMPSTGKCYQLGFYLWDEQQGKHTRELICQKELSVDTISTLFPAIVANYCAEANKRGEHFELTPQIIQHYKFKARYVEEVRAIVEQCNKTIK